MIYTDIVSTYKTITRPDMTTHYAACGVLVHAYVATQQATHLLLSKDRREYGGDSRSKEQHTMKGTTSTHSFHCN